MANKKKGKNSAKRSKIGQMPYKEGIIVTLNPTSDSSPEYVKNKYY